MRRDIKTLISSLLVIFSLTTSGLNAKKHQCLEHGEHDAEHVHSHAHALCSHAEEHNDDTHYEHSDCVCFTITIPAAVLRPTSPSSFFVIERANLFCDDFLNIHSLGEIPNTEIQIDNLQQRRSVVLLI